MQNRPTKIEITQVAAMGANERLHYFLTRAIEAEEIWSLGNANGWELQQRDGRELVPIWPYLELARINKIQKISAPSPQATSLDHFFQNILPSMIEQKIDLEVVCMPGMAGRLITATDLYAILEGMLEAGEYYLEG